MNRIHLPSLFALACAIILLDVLLVSSAYAQTASVTIRWTAPTTHTDNSPITTPLTYNVYSGAKGAVKTKIGTVGAGTTTFAAPNVVIGSCFAVTAVESGAGESVQSSEACMLAVPKPPAGVTFITITVS